MLKNSNNNQISGSCLSPKDNHTGLYIITKPLSCASAKSDVSKRENDSKNDYHAQTLNTQSTSPTDCDSMSEEILSPLFMRDSPSSSKMQSSTAESSPTLPS